MENESVPRRWHLLTVALQLIYYTNSLKPVAPSRAANQDRYEGGGGGRSGSFTPGNETMSHAAVPIYKTGVSGQHSPAR